MVGRGRVIVIGVGFNIVMGSIRDLMLNIDDVSFVYIFICFFVFWRLFF